MKNTKIIDNIGTLNLNDFEIMEDAFSAFVDLDMDSLSADMRSKVNAAIAKAVNEYNEEFDTDWKQGNAVIDWIGLMIDFDGSGIKYYISVNYHDATNDRREDCVNVRFDMSAEDLTEVKTIILNAIWEKFFNAPTIG